MMAQEIIDKLDDLLVILTKSPSNNHGQVTLPSKFPANVSDSIFNLIYCADEIREDYRFAFLGYDALGFNEVASEFENNSQRHGFFGVYDYETNLTLTEDAQIALEDSLEGDLETSEMMNDLSAVIPLFRFQGDYIVADLGKGNDGALVTIVDGYNGSLLAPSLIEHVDDLKSGLQEHSYKIIDDELIFPSAWYQRKGVRSGQLIMDDYGEICT